MLSIFDIFLYSETKIDESFKIKLKNFKIFREDRNKIWGGFMF